MRHTDGVLDWHFKARGVPHLLPVLPRLEPREVLRQGRLHGVLPPGDLVAHMPCLHQVSVYGTLARLRGYDAGAP